MGTLKQNQTTQKTCYAQSQQIRQIRKKMTDIITREVSSSALTELVNKLIPDSMSVISPRHAKESILFTTFIFARLRPSEDQDSIFISLWSYTENWQNYHNYRS